MKKRIILAVYLFTLSLLGDITAARADGVGSKIEDLKQKWTDISKTLEADIVLEKATEQLMLFSKQIAEISPQLEEMGFSISTLRMQMLPPKGLLRLTSEFVPDEDELYPKIASDASILEKAIIMSAIKAKQIQNLLELSQVVMDIEIDINPSIRISYRKSRDEFRGGDSRFSDIDLVCGQAL